MEISQATGALLPGIVQTGEIASPERSTNPLASTDLATLPNRLDDVTLANLRALVASPLPDSDRCSEEHFKRCMKSLDILPRRADHNAGELRMKLYWAKLSGFSDEALSYLVSKGLEQFHFFPTIAEAFKLLADFPNRSRDSERKEKAEHLIRRELNLRMDEAVAALGRRELSQDAIDALPDLTKRVAAEKGYLWKWPDGRFTVRLDLDRLDPEARDVERARIKAMLAEWDLMTADREAAE